MRTFYELEMHQKLASKILQLGRIWVFTANPMVNIGLNHLLDLTHQGEFGAMALSTVQPIALTGLFFLFSAKHTANLTLICI